jgi:uncharacterized SAM-binding protein YcdF (DUF218 family)
MKRRLGARQTAILVVSLALLDVGGVSIWWWAASSQAAERAPVQRADAAIVFFGDWGAQTETRVGEAVDLLASGEAGAVILVGGCRPTEDRNGGELMMRFALAKGADSSKLFPDTCSYDTRSNLEAVADIAAREHFTSFIFISDALHLQRIRALARKMPAFVNAAESVGQSFSPAWAWTRAHYEIAALAVNALPSGARDSIVRSSRGQPGGLSGADR